MVLKKGNLLIADPSILNDSSFKRSIILLTDHSEKSSVGFILNRPTEYVLSDFIEEISCDFVIYEGGPVEQDNLYFIHRLPELLTGSSELSNGLFWGGDFEQLKYLLQEQLVKPQDIRFFLGYSGWGTYQLQDEINMKSWFVSSNSYENILTENEALIWKNELLKKGGDYQIWANAPADIQQN